MKDVQKPIRTIVSSAILGLGVCHVAEAGSFSLYTESSPAAVGNYGAGIAAEAADASTGWYNPAGLVLIPGQQAVIGGVGVFPSSTLTGQSTYTSPLVPPYVQPLNDIDGAKKALVPSVHYVRPLGENAAFGFSVVSPFGLSTDWSVAGPVRYAATQSKLLTINASPEFAARLSENIAFGAGLDLQYATVKFNSMLGSPAVLQAIGESPVLFDSESYNSGNSFAVGAHAGVMFMMNENHSRVGVNYQSQMNHKFHGYSRLSGLLASATLSEPGAIFWSNSLSSNEIKLPQVITISGYQDLNEKLALLGSLVFTGWHSFQEIELRNVAAFSPTAGQVHVNSTSQEHYRDTWRFAVGANYRYSPQLMFRVGTGYDETPTVDRYRDVRIADSSRVALSVGAHYQATPRAGVDFGYTHLFSTGDVSVNETIAEGTSSYNVSARAGGSADLVGLQVVWNIDDVSVPVTK